MVNMRTAALSALLGLGIGTPAAHALRANQKSVFDPLTYNVIYDLKCLYGDADGDGKLSRQEYESFDIGSLLSSRVRNGFAFLGFNPVGESDMLFYLYSETDIREATSCSLTYRNSAAQNSDGSFADDRAKTSKASYVNSYPYQRGFFYKFDIADYPSVSNDGDMRIKADSFEATSGSSPLLDVDLKAYGEAELFYSGSDRNRTGSYFEDSTYSIRGAVDLLLCGTEQSTDVALRSFWFFPFVTFDHIDKAKEVFYFFFDFDDPDFRPDEIKKVTWQCQVQSFRQVNYFADFFNGDGQPTLYGWPGIYQGKYSDVQQPINRVGNLAFFSGVTDEIQMSGTPWQTPWSLSGQADGTIGEVTQSSRLNGWVKHSVIRRKYKIPSIVNMSTYQNDYSGDEFRLARDFLGAGDHPRYQWAYAIQDDRLMRQVIANSEHQTEMDTNGHTAKLFSTTTSCHQPVDGSIVTLGMTVRRGLRTFDIRVMNNPESVRDVYMVAYPAPTIADFIRNDLRNLFPDIPDWVPWVPAAIALLIVLLIIPKAWRGMAFVFRGIGYVFKAAIDLLYIVFVWWWLAIIRKIEAGEQPPLWIWRK